MAGTLYLVATPIGNLEDITQRALRLLREVELIACEDTRHTRVLLNHYGITTRMLSYHEHNERERADELGELLAKGSSIAVVSDAGTPGINDPGFRLVNEAIKRGATVVPVPGATALVAALVASGLPTDQFFFGGFLPARSTQRRARLAEVRTLSSTLIFYEAPHRIREALTDAREILGERARGEMVLLIDRHVIADGLPESDSAESVASRVAALEQEGLSARDALKRAAR